MILTPQLRYGSWIIVMSFVVAIMLTMLPLPSWAVNWRPDWVIMVLIYWCIALPNRIGIGSGWCLGLILDVQQNALLGQHALGLVLLTYITLKYHQRIRTFPLAQQAVIVCCYLLIYRLLMLLISGYIGITTQDWTYWMPAVTSMLFWPWLFIILRDIRRKYHIF